MPGLTITISEGESAEVLVPLEDEEGRETNEKVRVTYVKDSTGRASVCIEAPRDFSIQRVDPTVSQG
jgi:hypothetical protein